MTTLNSSWNDEAQRCPVSGLGAEYRPYEHDGLYDFFRRARREEPVFWNDEIRYFVVTRREDVLAVLADVETFSASITLSPVHSFPPDFIAAMKAGGFSFQSTLVNADPPLHDRLRGCAQRFLNAKRYNTYEDRIRAMVREHLDRVAGAPSFDMVQALTYEVPAKVLALLLGIDDIDPTQIKRWGDQRLLLTFGDLSGDDLRRAGEELVDYWQYCVRLVHSRLENPTGAEDYPSMLLAMRNGDDSILSLTDIYGLVFGVMLAGHETTTNATGNLLLTLMQNRDEWERLKADPSLIPNAVEEGLRYASSVVNWRRRATRDCKIGGVDIPAGSNVLISLASANTDESHFSEPERFDVGRAAAREHIAFGKGRHFCLGAPLARLEIRIMLEEVLARFPDMRLAEGFQPDWIRTITFRGPESLPVVTA